MASKPGDHQTYPVGSQSVCQSGAILNSTGFIRVIAELFLFITIRPERLMVDVIAARLPNKRHPLLLSKSGTDAVPMLIDPVRYRPDIGKVNGEIVIS